MKTVKFLTLGCKVNQYETQQIRENFVDSGFKELSGSLPADIYIINTCTVTQKADQESLYCIRRSFRENPRAKIVVTGCLTELDREAISRQPGVCLIVNNQQKNRLFNLLFKDAAIKSKTGITNFKGHNRAFLKIQDGCDNFCSYCKVPLVRGKSRSVPLKKLIQQAKALVENDLREIVLTGICLGSYGGDLKPRLTLVDLIEALEELDDLWRIRLSSIEAKDITEDLIRKMSESKKLCQHLHIPMQSGDDQILKLMHRKYTHESCLQLIKQIKRLVPGLALTTDIMVGFPGESKEAFQNSIKLVKEVIPLKVHIFRYSPREGTKAASLGNNIGHDVVKERISKLEKINEACSYSYKRRFLNKIVKVLIESKSKVLPDCWEGHSDNYIKVVIRSKKDLKNKLIPLKIKSLAKDFAFAEFA